MRATENDIKVLVLGNSFGRDWCNVLNESKYADKIDISYIDSTKLINIENGKNRFKEADLVFMVLEEGYGDLEYGIPNFILKYIDQNKLYVVGDKNFGTSNNLIYLHRKNENYFNYTVSIDKKILQRNTKLHNFYGDRYIDIINSLKDENGKIRVFTDNDKFISWDCRHLTQDGAKYLSKVIDLTFLER